MPVIMAATKGIQHKIYREISFRNKKHQGIKKSLNNEHTIIENQPNSS
jgi:hypothetical protein